MSYNSTDRRFINDRRLERWKVSFPLRTHDDVVISHDRRVKCERRTQGLEVTETDMSLDAFLEIYNTLLSKSNYLNKNIDTDTTDVIGETDAFNDYFNHE